MRRIILCLFLSAACATAEKHPDTCCERLQTRNQMLKKYERLCIGLVFLEGRFKDDARAVENIRAGLEVCKYVYGVR
jgi:hypothetical protein